MGGKPSDPDYYRKYYIEHGERIRARVAAWRAENKDRVAERARQRVREGTSRSPERNRRSRARLKAQVITAYGGRCVCCGETETEFLSIDHVNGGGTRERKVVNGGGLSWRLARDSGYSDCYRVLCLNCNWSAHQGNGICVHQRSGEKP